MRFIIGLIAVFICLPSATTACYNSSSEMYRCLHLFLERDFYLVQDLFNFQPRDFRQARFRLDAMELNQLCKWVSQTSAALFDWFAEDSNTQMIVGRFWFGVQAPDRQSVWHSLVTKRFLLFLTVQTVGFQIFGRMPSVTYLERLKSPLIFIFFLQTRSALQRPKATSKRWSTAISSSCPAATPFRFTWTCCVLWTRCMECTRFSAATAPTT